MRADDGGPSPGPNGETATGENRRVRAVTQAKILGDNPGPSLTEVRLLTVLPLDLQVENVSEFIHRGHRVVPSLECFSDLSQGTRNPPNDQLGSHQLTNGELLTQH